MVAGCLCNKIDVVFFSPRDADDAVSARDGYNYDGYRLRVEFPRGGSGGGRGGFRGGYGGGGGFRGGRGGGGRGRGGRSGPPSRRSDYRCLVSGTAKHYRFNVLDQKSTLLS